MRKKKLDSISDAEGMRIFLKDVDHFPLFPQVAQCSAADHDKNQQISEKRDPRIVESLIAAVIEGSLPDEYRRPEFRMQYFPDRLHVVVDYRLPSIWEIPDFQSVIEMQRRSNQVGTTVLGALMRRKATPAGSIQKTRSAAGQVSATSQPTHGFGKIPKEFEQARVYRHVIASTVFYALRAITTADHKVNVINSISLNGYAATRNENPHDAVCLIAATTRKEQILKPNILSGNRWNTLAALGAEVSDCPEKYLQVAPVQEFTKKHTFFSKSHSVATKPKTSPVGTLNLRLLTPLEFEKLIARLFEKIGFVVQLTSISHDGGIDCNVVDPRPLVGGRIIVQAKHYEGAVGVSAVRDLYGTLHHEGAGKGILITTGSFSTGCYRFATGKPIELLDGPNFVNFLQQNGINARL